MANTITRSTARQIRTALEAALNEVGAEFGLHSSIGTIRFSTDNLSCKIELSAMNEDGIIQSPAADQFIAKAYGYGLNPEELGQWFTSHGGRKLQIIGLNARAKRYPIQCRAEDGRVYKFAATAVRGYLDTRKVTA